MAVNAVHYAAGRTQLGKRWMEKALTVVDEEAEQRRAGQCRRRPMPGLSGRVGPDVPPRSGSRPQRSRGLRARTDVDRPDGSRPDALS